MSYMDSASKIADPFFSLSCAIYLSLWSYVPFKGSECNFVSKIIQTVLKIGASNLDS